MRQSLGLVMGLFLATWIGCAPQTPSSKSPAGALPPASAEPTGLEVSGRAQVIPTRKGIIAPAVLHPVEEVRVAVGDRVTKGQALVKLDDDEPQADVRAKQAALKNTQIAVAEARRYLAAVEKANAAVPEQKYHEARVAVLKAEMDERIAQAALEAAQAELEHYLVTAPIDGIITWLEVHPGMVSRPGTTVWGEILDLREIDVRCDVAVAQAERVALGQEAEIRRASSAQREEIGRVVSVGIAADSQTGLVPVLIRLANSQGRLRCGVPVQVRFRDRATAGAAK